MIGELQANHSHKHGHKRPGQNINKPNQCCIKKAIHQTMLGFFYGWMLDLKRKIAAPPIL